MKKGTHTKIVSLMLVLMMLVPSVTMAETINTGRSQATEITKPDTKKTKITSTWNTSGKARDLDYYYTDEYFTKLKSCEYNEHLASCSLALAISAGSKESSFVEDTLGETSGIGCTDVRSYEYGDENTYKSVGFAIGKRKLTGSDDTILVPVMLRGGNYTYEWGMNFIAGLNGNAVGYDWPANKVYSIVRKYIGNNKNVKIWISGYSRAGSVANLLARKLSNYYGRNRVYAYCFDAPMSARYPSSKYTNIHNVQNMNDGIALVLPEYMKFGRNGNASRLIGDLDNESKMLECLKGFTRNVNNRYKSPKNMTWHRLVINLDFTSVSRLVKSVKNLVNGGKFYEFEDESVCTPDEVWKAVLHELKQIVPTRSTYVKSGLQKGLSNLAVLYESLTTKQINELKASIKEPKTLIKLATNLNLVEALISVQRGKMPSLTDAQYKCIANTIYSALIEDSESFSKTQKALARKALNGSVEALLKFLAVDYKSDNQVLGTIIQDNNLDKMLQCHYYDVNMAYMMTLDSYYND